MKLLAGGDVITTSGRSIDHATLTGLTAQRISLRRSGFTGLGTGAGCPG